MHKLLFLMIFIVNSAMAQSGDHFSYQVNNQSYDGYFADAGKNSPLILLVHDWDGLTDYEVTRANMLAKLGYSVMAADLFGSGVRPKKVVDKKQHTGELYRDRVKMRKLLNGALNAAQAKGASLKNVIAVGYCFGGAAILELARTGADIKAFVSFHGGLKTPKGQDYSKAKGEYLIFHGSADRAIKIEDFTALAQELNSAKLPSELITYGGANHAFTVYGGKNYNKNADQKSWNRFIKFLDNKFAK